MSGDRSGAEGALVAVPVTREHAAALGALFERCESACYCRYWHFAGDKNAWLERCALAPGKNREELTAALEHANAGDDLLGVVALTPGGDVAGWMKLSAAQAVPKLYDQRLYRGLSCFSGERAGVLVVGCFLIDEPWRRQGVARRLLGAGIDAARRRGARALEAFPRRSSPLRPDEQWTGPLQVFESAGFAVVHDFGPYPVLRLTL